MTDLGPKTTSVTADGEPDGFEPPVAWYTDGQKIPEDLQRAEAIPLVRLGVERLKAVQSAQTVAEGA